MAMNREKKAVLVDSLREIINGSQASFVVQYKGLTVDKLQELRSQLRKDGGTFKIAKARLMKRAVDGLEGAQDLTPFLKEQVGIVFAQNDSAAVAKALTSFAQTNEALTLVVGLMDSRVLQAADVQRIASLPSREVLLAQLCGTLQAPTAKLTRTLNTLILRLLWTIQAVSDKKQ